MPNDYVGSIAIDEYGNKWIGTRGGLSVFNANGVSIKEKQQIENNITIYPNPAGDHLNIEALSKNEISSFDIINIQGKLIESKKINSSYQAIDVSDLSTGIYILKIRTKEGWRIKKFIKQ